MAYSPNKINPTAQWVTSGEDPGYGRQKIREGAMPQGRSRSPSSKRPDTYPMSSWQAAGGIHSPKSLPCLRHGSGNALRWSIPIRKERRNKILQQQDHDIATYTNVFAVGLDLVSKV